MAAEVRLRIRGVRAFHSAPSRENLTTGGNTSSIELIDGDQHLFINAGFGINDAGDDLIARRKKTKKPIHCAILFSDFMWDATMGFPFFTPVHFKSTKLDIYAGASESVTRAGLNDVSSSLFTPFGGVDSLPATITISQTTKPSLLGNWTLHALAVEHPLTPYPVTVWRLTHKTGIDIGVILTCNNDQNSINNVTSFLSGCGTLICAASDSPTTDGWDQHRTKFSDALLIAQKIGAQDLYLTQFHPEMTDILLQKKLQELQSSMDRNSVSRSSPLHIHLGSEIESIRLMNTKPQTKAS